MELCGRTPADLNPLPHLVSGESLGLGITILRIAAAAPVTPRAVVDLPISCCSPCLSPFEPPTWSARQKPSRNYLFLVAASHSLLAARSWRLGCRGDARPKLSRRRQAAHEFLFAGQQVPQPRASGVGFDAALHFGQFLLGLALLERFDAA